MNEQDHRCGRVAIVGRPNVGKSTLLNQLVGQRLSITSRKPQTTRYKVVGIYTAESAQLIFIDTPGWEQRARGGINRSMNRQITAALEEVDVVIFVADARTWTADDERILSEVKPAGVPIILVLNKIDLVVPKEKLLAYIEAVQSKARFAAIVPLSAQDWERAGSADDAGGLRLRQEVIEKLPIAPFLFDESEITDQPTRFFAAEIVREKLLRYLGDELPYSCSVIIEQFDETADGVEISALIWVERESHKAMVIGSQGESLKRISSAARRDLEQLLDTHVYLRTWVKVRENWRNDENALRQLGFEP